MMKTINKEHCLLILSSGSFWPDILSLTRFMIDTGLAICEKIRHSLLLDKLPPLPLLLSPSACACQNILHILHVFNFVMAF